MFTMKPAADKAEYAPAYSNSPIAKLDAEQAFDNDNVPKPAANAFTPWFGREGKRDPTYEQGIAELRERFHRTRLTRDIAVDPDALYAVLYGRPDADHAANVNALVALLHGKSTANRWWIDPKTGQDLAAFDWFPYVIAAKLMLTVSELAEGMEGSRKGLMDDKLPHRPMLEVELADAVIRIADLAGKLGYDLGGAIVEKTAFNDNRPDHKMEARQAAGGKAY